jgi:hypothetical protein
VSDLSNVDNDPEVPVAGDDPEPGDGAAAETAGDETEGQDDAGDPDAEAGEEADESEELDIAGTKLAIPKGALPAEARSKIEEIVRGFQGDYTRKTQDIADKAKALETREGVVQKLSTLNGDMLATYAKGLHLGQELQELRKIDAQALWQSNPDQARQLSDVIAAKQAELASTTAELNHKEHEFTQEQAKEAQRRSDEGRQLVERQIKGFNAQELVDYAIKSGIPKAEAEKWPLNPTVTIMAHKAMMFDRMQAKATKPAPKAGAEPVTSAKAKGAGGSRPALDLIRDADKISTEEWVRRERARMAKKNGAA